MGDMAVSLTGRRGALVDAEVVRELTAADLVLLDVERGIKPVHVKKLRDSHHKAARLIAQGLPMWEVSLHTGLTASRISVLKADPSFQELLALYRQEVGEVNRTAYADGVQKMAALHSDALDEIHDRLDEEPEKFTFADLHDLVKLTSDRIGLGPQSRTTNLNVHVGIADTIAEGFRRFEEASTALNSPAAVIEGEVSEGQADASPSPSGDQDG